MEAVRALRGPDRRRAKRFYVHNERRTGFDRRVRERSAVGAVYEATLLHLRDRPATLAALLLLGNLLSLTDLLLTWASLHLGAAEVNPVMRYLLELGPSSAAAAKLGLIAAASLAIWVFRRYRLVLAIALYLTAFYCFVVLYETVGLARLL